MSKEIKIHPVKKLRSAFLTLIKMQFLQADKLHLHILQFDPTLMLIE